MTAPAKVTVAGVLVLALAWSGVLGRVLPPFTSHMIAHMSVVALAAPLLALGLCRTPLDPVARWPRLWRAVPMSMVEGVAVWAWHVPAAHRFARTHLMGGVLEQLTFLSTGLLLWTAALGGEERRRRGRMAGNVTGLLLTSMHMTLLGALIALSHRTLYAHPHEHGRELSAFGATISGVQDQQLGGAAMILLGGAAYLAGALALVWTELEPTAEAVSGAEEWEESR